MSNAPSTPDNNVLIVDADDRALAMVARGFTREGWKVAVANRADEAQRFLASSRPALIFSEVELPDAKGFSLCETVRADRSFADVPVFLLAKKPDAILRARAHQVGAVDVVGKPVFVQDLVTLGRIHAGKGADSTFHVDLGQRKLAYLLRAITAGSRAGRILVHGGDGRVYFREGRVVDASYKHLTGERALLRMLTIERGPAELEFAAHQRRETMHFDARALLGKGFTHARRWHQVLATLCPLASVLEVDFRALSKHLDQIPDRVNGVIRLFDGHRSLEEVLDQSGLDDLTAVEVVAKLDSLAILKPVQPRRPLEAPVAAEPDSAPAAESIPAGEPSEDLMAALFPDGAPAVEVMPPEALVGFDEYEKGKDPWEAILPAGDLTPAEGTSPLRLEDLRVEIEPAPAPLPARPPELVALKPSAVLGEAPAPAATTAVADAHPPHLEDHFFDTHGGAHAHGAAEEHAHAFAEAEKAPPEERPSRGLWVAMVLFVVAAVVAFAVFSRTNQQLPPPPSAPEPVAALPVPEPEPVAEPAEPAEPADESATLEELLALGQDRYDHRDFAGALDAFEQATAKAPESPEATMLLGLALYESGDAKGASEVLRHARVLAPKNARAAVLLGAAYQSLADTQKARIEYEEFLKLEPAGKTADEVRHILAVLR